MAIGSLQERIRKMKEAIETQAKQRANYIVQKAEEEADIERVSIIKAENQKIDTEYMHLIKNEKVKAKIQKSSMINRQRICKMEVRHQMIKDVKKELKEALKLKIADKQNYKNFLQDLIVQGMLRFLQRNLAVQIISDQLSIFKQIIPACEAAFKKTMKKETGREMECKLIPSEFKLEDQYKGIIGGVFLRSMDGTIVCNNSVDARINLIFEQLLPVIRNYLFPKTPIKQ